MFLAEVLECGGLTPLWTLWTSLLFIQAINGKSNPKSPKRCQGAALQNLCEKPLLSPMQPPPQDRQHLLRVHRLGQVVPRAGLDALLAVPLHRLGRHRNDR